MDPLEAVSLAVLVAVLAFAVVRPRGLAEAVAAVPGAALLVAVGAVSPDRALASVRGLLGVVVFLVAVLVIADAADADGLFAAVGQRVGAAAGGDPRRLLGLVVAVAAVTTSVLSLDATVVLLTPVLLAAARASRLPPRPHVYACGHLANAGSLLLPVANLTNLLAFAATGLSFVGFGLRMLLPWLAVVAVEYGVLRLFFAAELRRPAPAAGTGGPAVDRGVPLPRPMLVILGLVLVAMAGAEPLGVAPMWAAVAGAVVCLVRGWRTGRVPARRALAAASPGFALFVLALGVIAAAVTAGGLGAAARTLVPGGRGLAELLAVAAVTAVLANLVNNLPAVLLMVPLLRAGGTPDLLAMLVGANVGPNLSYVGSLATLLWRRLLRTAAPDAAPAGREFHVLGAVSVPLALGAGVVALWAGLHLFGG